MLQDKDTALSLVQSVLEGAKEMYENILTISRSQRSFRQSDIVDLYDGFIKLEMVWSGKADKATKQQKKKPNKSNKTAKEEA